MEIDVGHLCCHVSNKPVDMIATDDVLAVLKPIWTTKPETGSRVRGRIEKVLDGGKAKGFRRARTPPVGAVTLITCYLVHRSWRAAIMRPCPMPTSRDLSRNSGYAAPPPRWRWNSASSPPLAPARSSACAGKKSTWNRKVWTVPAHRMEAGREHRVPLSKRATDIVVRLSASRSGDFVFAGQRRDKPLSNMAMEMMLRRMKIEDATVHGFRSSFRDWAGNETGYPRELIETAFAHVIGNTAEQAYRRSDALEKRRDLMEAWARFCEAVTAANVVPMRQSR